MNRKLLLGLVVLFCLLAFPLKSIGSAAGPTAPLVQDGPVATPTPDPLAVEEPQAPSGPSAPSDYFTQLYTRMACIGTDCVDGEVLLNPLKVNDPSIRIFFDDSDTDNDWAIKVNDTGVGGSEYFAIQDVSGNKVPFRIRAEAPDNALYISSVGDLGLGTQAPAADLHIVDTSQTSLRFENTGDQVWEIGNFFNFIEFRDITNNRTPFSVWNSARDDALAVAYYGVGIGTQNPVTTLHLYETAGPTNLRFEQASPAQIWEIDTDDDHLIFKDVTAGRSPFWMDAAAPTNSLVLRNTGRVGIGTSAPQVDLHVAGDISGANMILANSSGAGWKMEGYGGYFKIGSTTSSTEYLWMGNGNVGIGTVAPQAKLHVAGDLRVDGFVNERSDAAAKTAFAAVNGQDVLDKLASVPIRTWSYKDTPDVRHMGPMAQDFRAAYGLGPDDRHLAALDTNGVALAAIQALDAQDKDLKAQVQERDAQISELQARVKALEARSGASLWSQLGPFAFSLLGLLAGVLISRKRK